jgi:branched-subunit amino acid transport protein
MEIDKAVRSWAKYVGSTALTAYIVDNILFIANVGKSPLMYSLSLSHILIRLIFLSLLPYLVNLKKEN